MSRFEMFAAIYSGLVQGNAWKDVLIDWAVTQLQSGVDTPNLRILAGLSPSDYRTDVEGYFEAVLRDLGEAPLGDVETRLGQARAAATALLDGDLTPCNATRLVHDLVVGPLNHPPSLQPWCDLDGGFVSLDGVKVRQLEAAELDEEIRGHASRFLSVDPSAQLETLMIEVGRGAT